MKSLKIAQNKINVTRPYLPDKKIFDKLTNEIWDNSWLTNDGPLLKRFNVNLKKYLGCNNLELFVNGHSALDIAIRASGITGEVITTPFSFASTTHAITMNDAKPIFCDIDPKDYTIDPKKIESLITDETQAIIPVHVYGYPCNVKEIEKIAKKNNLIVIYDSAHAFGVRYRGKSLANYGDVSMISFHATKLFHSIEGGALLFQDEKLGNKLRAYRNFGISSEIDVDYVGGNSKMNEFQAAMGLINLEHIDNLINERKTITEKYRQRLSKIEGISFHVPENNPNIEYNYSYMPIVVDNEKYGLSRDELYEKLKKYNIFTRRYFYPLISNYSCYSNIDKMDLPVSTMISNSIMCLPIYNGLTHEEVDYICDAIEIIGEHN